MSLKQLGINVLILSGDLQIRKKNLNYFELKQLVEELEVLC